MSRLEKNQSEVPTDLRKASRDYPDGEGSVEDLYADRAQGLY